MKSTYFKPSIHGWPFANNFRYQITYEQGGLDVGLCGGMCWTVLKRFFNAIPIPRDTQNPSCSDPLIYSSDPYPNPDLHFEILAEQMASLNNNKIGKIYDWQISPDMSHKWNPQHSLGHRTLGEWPHVQEKLDAGLPVTLTLIVSSNDYNPVNLQNHHRVIAYAYDVRPLSSSDWVHGDRKSSITAITINIYDPNYPNNDHVYLTFYTGCDRSWIGLRHSEDNPVHGFFLDDESRYYSNHEITDVWINHCIQTGISSRNEADYELSFSWKCRFIPYFCVQINGINWRFNHISKGYLPPTDKDDKQCPVRVGSMALSIKLPRKKNEVTVKLLGSEDFCRLVKVDAQPAIICYPYVVTRTPEMDSQHVCDIGITDKDLFIKNANPSENSVRQLDTSPFRWVMLGGKVLLPRPPLLSKGYIEIIDKYQLGNIQVPIMGNFVERNLAGPTSKSGSIKITQNGQLLQNIALTSLSDTNQKIFDGFINNPADYDNDTTVEFTYTSCDKFGVVAKGQAIFYGKSIIFRQFGMEYHIFDGAQVAKAELILHDLIEKGLVDVAIGSHLPPNPIPDLPVIIKKLRSNQQLEKLINKTMIMLFKRNETWEKVWDIQSNMMKEINDIQSFNADRSTTVGDRHKARIELKMEEQRKYDAVIYNAIAQGAIGLLSRDPTVIKFLKSL